MRKIAFAITGLALSAGAGLAFMKNSWPQEIQEQQREISARTK